MVAALLRLRFRVLANTLRRSPLQLAAVIAGSVPVVVLVAVALAALSAASRAPADLVQPAIVAAGALTVLGWLVVPLLLDGVDDTLDPRRLARFPVRPAQLMTATVLSALFWVPGAATLVCAVGTTLAWSADPAVSVAAAGAGVLGTLTCVVGARAVTACAGTLVRGGSHARIFTVVLVLAIVSAPLAPVIAAGSREGTDPLSAALAAIDALAWTPFGAAWSIPGRLAAGDAAGAIGASAVALATAIGLALLWRLALHAAPGARGGAARSPVQQRAGLLGRAPTGTAGAVAARSLVYWFRDPRRARQLLLLPAVPGAMMLWWRLLDADAIALAIGPVVAVLLPLAAFADLSYDGTAFASQLAAGVHGRADRAGRAAALLVIGLPTALVAQVAVAAAVGRLGDLPALLGLTVGILLVAVGVSAVSSAIVVVPVPRSGRSPFAAPAGAMTLSVVASYAVLGATLVAGSPIIAVAVAALVSRSAAIGWVALACGLVVGAAALAGGILVGGRVLERTAPALLARLRLDRD